MRKDTRFSRPDRSDIEAKLPPGTLKDAQAMGIWNMMLRASDPSEVCHLYRSYRDSKYSAVPKPSLRAMRDTMITSMREANRQDPSPRKERKLGVHYNGHNNGFVQPRRGA